MRSSSAYAQRQSGEQERSKCERPGQRDSREKKLGMKARLKNSCSSFEKPAEKNKKNSFLDKKSSSPRKMLLVKSPLFRKATIRCASKNAKVCAGFFTFNETFRNIFEPVQLAA